MLFRSALVDHYYTDFLTEQEIEDMMRNKREIYMTAEEFAERLNARSAKNGQEN